MADFHLAQINIARARYDLTSPAMHGFVSRLEQVNALADASPGFIWRLQTEDGDATALRVFDDPLLVINMSVWRDIESLKNFVYRSLHSELYKNRSTWFDRIDSANQALWWLPAGSLPTIDEGKVKLQLVERQGETPAAFTFARQFAVE